MIKYPWVFYRNKNSRYINEQAGYTSTYDVQLLIIVYDLTTQVRNTQESVKVFY